MQATARIRPVAVRAIVRLLFIVALLQGPPASAAPDFSRVRAALNKAVADGTVAGGSVLVLHRGEVVFAKSFGFADIRSKAPFRLDSPVVIASISKPLLGTAAFRLAERGKLNLSVPISKYLPEFESRKLESGVRLARAPTTIELFTHTSGIRNDAAPNGRPWFASWTKSKSLADVVKHYAAEFPFMAQPGTRYAYSGIGTDVAARVLEVAAGRPRNELLVAEVNRPLGMSSTFYRDAESIKRMGPMPTRYYRGKDGKLRESRRRLVPPTNTYSSSGGSVISSAPDLARWLLMIRNAGQHESETYLKRESLAEMLATFPRSSNARGGFFIRKKDGTGKAVVVGHTGSSGTNCWIDFEQDLIGVMLTQTRGKDIKPFRIEVEKRINESISEKR